MKYKDWAYRKATYYVYDSDILESTTFQVCYGIKFRFRFDPVPEILRFRRGPRKYYRRPLTTNELRWSYACDIQRFIRGKRRSGYLVNAWSDLNIADNKTRSWKRTKKLRQWM